jgi:hypothetical protein
LERALADGKPHEEQKDGKQQQTEKEKFHEDLEQVGRDFLRNGFTRILKQQNLWWLKG